MLALSALQACSGAQSSDTPLEPVDCGFSACGGSLLGSWKATGACIQGLPAVADCPAATLRVGPVASGSLTFDASAHYSFDLAISGDLRIDLPVACTANASCADVGASLAAACLDSGAGCSCSSSLEPSHLTSEGSYVTRGNSVATTDSTGQPDAPEPEAYCVRGQSLQLQMTRQSGAITVIRATLQP